MNVLAVREAVKFAMKHAQTEGPVMMEMDTYRYHGHSMSDPGVTYRSRDEVSEVRQARDPVQFVKSLLLEQAGCNAEEVKAIEKKVRGVVDDAVAAAKAEAPPPSEELTRDIFHGETLNPRMVNIPLGRHCTDFD